MDFMSDSLSYGHRFRTLNVLDDFNRQALAIEVDTSLTAERVIRTLKQIIAWRGKPKQGRIKFYKRAVLNGVELQLQATLPAL
ncbi:IS3 family transposase, partial [Pseudoalteromonas ruthenica]